ncbi:MAG: ankyrin-3-like [Faunusvirus sp.]|uniref:Ankyrin-3-like n=1 Tax=Faunusvirus sp. TaxID=2487766 RepID=A0A3G4ZXD6_9VIRU|nr:MAG: ankyrin-3-like [Faunusvirus sp.]
MSTINWDYYNAVARHLYGLLYKCNQSECLEYMAAYHQHSNIYLNIQFGTQTLIAIAAELNLYDVVDDMIRRGVDPNLVNKQCDMNVLMVACRYNSLKTAYCLINNRTCNINIHIRNSIGQTALLIAIYYASYDIATYLITRYHVRELDIPNANGDTPLIIACKRPSRQIIANLLCRGVDVNIRNKAGYSALSYALCYQSAVCTLLLDHGVEFQHEFEDIADNKATYCDEIRLCLKNKYRDAIIHIINNNKTGFKKQFNKLLLFIKYKKHHPLYMSFKKTYAIDIIDIICDYII